MRAPVICAICADKIAIRGPRERTPLERARDKLAMAEGLLDMGPRGPIERMSLESRIKGLREEIARLEGEDGSR